MKFKEHVDAILKNSELLFLMHTSNGGSMTRIFVREFPLKAILWIFENFYIICSLYIHTVDKNDNRSYSIYFGYSINI